MDQENKEYARMVSEVSSSQDIYVNGTSATPNLSIGRELKAVSKLSLALLNALLSLVAVFVAVFYFGDSISNDVGVVGLRFNLCSVLVQAH